MTTTTKRKKKELTADDYKSAYITHLLMHGQKPHSVFSFVNELKSTEAHFYTHFNSFGALERTIWADWLVATTDALEADEAYAEYSVREKLLSFYYTWLETLKSNRSFVLMRFEKLGKTEIDPAFLESLKVLFNGYINDLILEGKDTEEVAERPFSSQYEKVFWLHFLFLMKFWSKDESADFEKTDAAIEKSVNLAFDLLSKGALDSMLDFGKFLFQNRK
ncbi:MAG: TetR/AcrR family transcriptional regulator [Cyclobacteriaceae bacterium]